MIDACSKTEPEIERTTIGVLSGTRPGMMNSRRIVLDTMKHASFSGFYCKKKSGDDTGTF
ncbi:MAG: hypothetical protein P8105_06850 [Dehalococcoidia bacterium]